MDCDGNAASSSTETGHPSALAWVWAWDWEWACNSPPRPPPLEPFQPGTTLNPRARRPIQRGAGRRRPRPSTATEPPASPGSGRRRHLLPPTTSATIPLYVQPRLGGTGSGAGTGRARRRRPMHHRPRRRVRPSLRTLPRRRRSRVSTRARACHPSCRGARAGAGLGDIAPPLRRAGGAPPVSRRRGARAPSLLLPELVSGPTQGLAGGFVTTDAIVISPNPHTLERAATPRTSAMPARLGAVEPWQAERSTSTRGTRKQRMRRSRTPSPLARSGLLSPPQSPAPFPERRRRRGLREQRRARRLELGHGSARLFPRFLRPRTRAANACNAGAEPARHVRIIHRSPWLNELSSLTRPCC